MPTVDPGPPAGRCPPGRRATAVLARSTSGRRLRWRRGAPLPRVAWTDTGCPERAPERSASRATNRAPRGRGRVASAPGRTTEGGPMDVVDARAGPPPRRIVAQLA